MIKSTRSVAPVEEPYAQVVHTQAGKVLVIDEVLTVPVMQQQQQQPLDDDNDNGGGGR